ncbi:MAG: DUF222 domain-containing protein [Nitriliruptoraceae bacterium]
MAALIEGDRRGGHAVVAEVLSCLSTDIDALTAEGPDELETATCEDVLKQVERAMRRLSTFQTRLVGAITERKAQAAAQAAEAAGRSTGVAINRARRAVEDFLSDQLGMAPTDARAATIDGQRRGEHRELDQARDAGDVGPRQARLVADFLDKLRTSSSAQLTEDELDDVRIQAIKQASRHDPVELGRWLRRRLGQIDPRRAELDESTRRRNRTAGFTTTDDGMWRLSATLSGLDAGIATQAIERFRVPDTAAIPEEQRRSPGQVTADAFVQMCRTALETDDTRATRAGVRPHVVVTIDYQTLLDREGIAEIERVGPVPFGEVRRLLADAGVARLLVDPDGLPVEAGPEVRTVPAALRRAIVLRDQGCIARSCSIPARWCQVAHLAQPFHQDGQLSPDNAALMCHHHHRQFDLHGWRIQWHASQPRLVPPLARAGSRNVEHSDPPCADELPSAETPAAASGKDPTVLPTQSATPGDHRPHGPPDPMCDPTCDPTSETSYPSRPPQSETHQLPLLAQESRGRWDPKSSSPQREHDLATGTRARPVSAASPRSEVNPQPVGTKGRHSARVCS